MKFPAPALLLAAFSLSAVGVVVLRDLERTSPGELALVHARVPELNGSDSCAQCHGGWFESMADSCLDCHEVIGEQLDEGRGLHGVLEPARARACALCHSDHHGEGFAIVDVQSFVHAGFENREAFEHARIGFAMDGAHLEQTCADCHVNADERFLEEGEQRFLGLDQNCASCHDDAHDGALVLACAECHTQHDFLELEPRGHDEFLELTGAHGGLDCRQCHAADAPGALEELGRADGPARACVDCHASPHREEFVAGVARSLATADGASCEHCHAPVAGATFALETPTMTPREHAFTGFALTEPHAELACEQCHAAALGDFAARHPGRQPDACAACHADVHDGQFEGGPFGGLGCLACHERTHFEPHAFDAVDHARTAFALEGTHAATACEACHAEPHADGPRVFAGTPGTCEDCHQDAHEDFFAKELAARNVAVDTCAECHRTTSFEDVDTATFDHGDWARFEVLGAHAHTACESCHPRAELPDEHGRRFGRAHEHFGAIQGCESCHQDPHEGGFDERAGTPFNMAGFEGCARCHVESSFRVMRADFDHGLWTGFPLTGQHFDLACADCHAPRAEPDAVGRTWDRALGRACSDCHSNPHAGQFREAGTTDCSRCHQSAASWSRLAFDHDRDSRFPLEHGHEKLDCAACHESWQTGDAMHGGLRSIVRYRPLGTECIDCHTSAEGGRR